MKALTIATLLMCAPLLSSQALAADSSTKITFNENSYCGSQNGNIKNGKIFRLWLQADQELVVSNQGNDQVNVAYVEGPNGRLTGDKFEKYNSYVTQRKGNHYIKVYGNDNYSSVDFCAY